MTRRCRCPKCDSMNTQRVLVGFSSDISMSDEDREAFSKATGIPIRYMYQCNECNFHWFKVERRRRCPKCGSLNTVKIMYGLPIDETLDLFEREKVVLGGCRVWPDSPKYYCKDCENHWGKLRSGDV